tara:strand:- start:327 stop:1283 length:957 start_codon:yes stop_codon:yes gene_type:complete
MIKKIIFVNLIAIITIIVSLELIAKTFKLSQLVGLDSNVTISNDENFHSLKKNSKGIVFGKKVFIDSNGFRVPYENFHYTLDFTSIFFIGDSTTFGNGVIEEDSFVGKIRSKKKNINIYNSAVPGYNIYHHEKNFNKIGKFKNIEKIFYIFTLNDIIAVKQINELRDEKFLKINFLNYINKFLRNKSYLYMYIKGVITDPSKRYFSYIIKAYNKEREFNSLKNYFSNLSKYSKSNNIYLKVIILPYEFQTRKNNCFGKNILPQKIIKNILISTNIEFEDYTKFFCDNNNPKNLFYKFDPMHLSEKGHDLVFSKILENL